MRTSRTTSSQCRRCSAACAHGQDRVRTTATAARTRRSCARPQALDRKGIRKECRMKHVLMVTIDVSSEDALVKAIDGVMDVPGVCEWTADADVMSQGVYQELRDPAMSSLITRGLGLGRRSRRRAPDEVRREHPVRDVVRLRGLEQLPGSFDVRRLKHHAADARPLAPHRWLPIRAGRHHFRPASCGCNSGVIWMDRRAPLPPPSRVGRRGGEERPRPGRPRFLSGKRGRFWSGGCRPFSRRRRTTMGTRPCRQAGS